MKSAVRTVVAIVALLLLGAYLPVRAQSALYFPATGHNLTDSEGFLSFWQANNGERLLGYPVTEVLIVRDQPVQYFERGRLEQQVDAATGTATVRLGRVGGEYAEEMWKSFVPPARSRTGRTFENGFTLREPFLSAWERLGGEALLGAPISEPVWERTERGQVRVQYFANVRLERNPARVGTPEEVVPGPLGRALALLRGYDLTPVANLGAATYGPSAAQPANVASLDVTPTPIPPTPAPKPQATAAPKATATPQQASKPAAAAPFRTDGKLIVVSLRDQWAYAYEDGKQVWDAPVSTGRDGMETPTGTYKIYTKLRSQTMDGVDNGVPWEVPDVPHVMYFNGGVALHGTYWHNRFGSGARLSHGCVNLPLKPAAWLYEWAPVGTLVKVTQ